VSYNTKIFYVVQTLFLWVNLHKSLLFSIIQLPHFMKLFWEVL